MENEKKVREKKENELGQKIKSLEGENSSLSKKRETDENMIILELKLENHEKTITELEDKSKEREKKQLEASEITIKDLVSTMKKCEEELEKNEVKPENIDAEVKNEQKPQGDMEKSHKELVPVEIENPEPKEILTSRKEDFEKQGNVFDEKSGENNQKEESKFGPDQKNQGTKEKENQNTSSNLDGKNQTKIKKTSSFWGSFGKKKL